MDDRQIVALFWDRNEKAIFQTQKKYHLFLLSIAQSILNNHEDAQETVNDTYARTWNAIPTDRPERLKPYLAKITRCLSIDLYRRNNAQKRGGGNYEASLEELNECTTTGDNPETEAERNALIRSVNRFLETIDTQQRNIFVQRYFYTWSVKEIAETNRITESNAKIILLRLRAKLKEHLIREGY